MQTRRRASSYQPIPSERAAGVPPAGRSCGEGRLAVLSNPPLSPAGLICKIDAPS